MIAKKLVTTKKADDDKDKSDKKKDKKTQAFQLTELLKNGNRIDVPIAVRNLTCGGQWHLVLPLSGGSFGCELHLPSGEILQQGVVMELLNVQRELAKLVKKEETHTDLSDIVCIIAAHEGGVGTAIDKVKFAAESIKARNKNVELFSAAIRGMAEYTSSSFDASTQVLLQFYTDQVRKADSLIREYITAVCTLPRVPKLVDWFAEHGKLTRWFMDRIWREGQLAAMTGNSNIFQLFCAGRALTLTAKERDIYGPTLQKGNFLPVIDTPQIYPFFSTDAEKTEFLRIPKMTEEVLTQNHDLLPIIYFNGNHIQDYMPVKGSTLLKAYSVQIPKVPGGERIAAFVKNICGRMIIGKSECNDTTDVERLKALLPTVPPLHEVKVLDHFNDILRANAEGIYQKSIFLAPDILGRLSAPEKDALQARFFLIYGSTPNLSKENREELMKTFLEHTSAQIEAYKTFNHAAGPVKDTDGYVIKPIVDSPKNPVHWAKDHARVEQILEARRSAIDGTKKKKSSKQRTQETKLLPVIAEELRVTYGITNVSQPIIDVIGNLKALPLQREAIRILYGIKNGDILMKEDDSSGSGSADEEP